ncbi:bactofilin family protein [Erwinia psidii]|uniref:Polymer-forming cytoskeletal protein n=1 Tax=Erwinia psidii TaxID=69224 RepID=A0A3N6S7B6_9GAMM|nr:polymer-forming cytoskeletal protein [Erwinia psidii]MCX8956947.1 polymer-forming cytoskeletal protein [Erwinia psidii]MCX8960242.1 polymer-forming cytoskeletal protein [Erwinia psidii]MCX8966272.1 polymer-forming cytoskeletal protein [Erwinia psidii]RQM36980.1 polymer-forming cytoskeletal protein [Erwinia psidii]
MNYNLLWLVWLIWSLTLATFSLGWETSLELGRQYPKLLTGLISATVAGVTLRYLLSKKEPTMFRRKESTVNQPTSSLSLQPEGVSPEENELAKNGNIEDIISAVSRNDVPDTTTIPETCLIVGEISAVGDIHINGAVNGTVTSEKTVFVQKNGRVDGEVYAKRIEISGELKGVCRSLELAVNASGHLNGTVECDSLSVNPNGRFYGHSKPYEPQPQEAEKNAASRIPEPVMSLSHDLHLREETLV